MGMERGVRVGDSYFWPSAALTEERRRLQVGDGTTNGRLSRSLAFRSDAHVLNARPWCRAGEASAEPPNDWIEDIYRRHAARFLRVASAIVEHAETAEDIVQEAFATAVVRRGSFRGAGAAEGWIWRIVVNKALSRRRRAKVERRLLDQPDVPADTTGSDEASDTLVRDHVARLPDRQKLALFLRYYADMEYETIAEILSIAPGTVGKLLHDARLTIKRAIEERGDG
jgi:RNA polymerase sigma factor (sigma-70 family)